MPGIFTKFFDSFYYLVKVGGLLCDFLMIFNYCRLEHSYNLTRVIETSLLLHLPPQIWTPSNFRNQNFGGHQNEKKKFWRFSHVRAISSPIQSQHFQRHVKLILLPRFYKKASNCLVKLELFCGRICWIFKVVSAASCFLTNFVQNYSWIH